MASPCWRKMFSVTSISNASGGRPFSSRAFITVFARSSTAELDGEEIDVQAEVSVPSSRTRRAMAAAS